jgi:acyl-CoA thioesterase-2
MPAPTLAEILALERLEANLFRGTTAEPSRGSIYGGQVIAQALLAAYQTVDERICHSLHCYFIRPGDPNIPIVFEVDRSRDGGSFTTRRVIAVQHGQQIFNLAASFQGPETGFEHQAPAPARPHWDAMPPEHFDDAAQVQFAGPKRGKPANRRFVDVRRLESIFDLTPGPAETTAWMRARDPIGADQPMQQVILAYASDMVMLTTALRPHPTRWHTPGMQVSSLDHAIWFHRPFDFNNWHVAIQDSPVATGGRGFIRSAIYDEAGVLVASTAQEGLIRMRRA